MTRSGRRPVAARALARAVLVAVAVAALAAAVPGCRPLYVPPVPQRQPTPAVARLGDASSLTYEDRSLSLHVILAEVPRAGWLAVQWFGPDDTEAASESTWVTPADVGQGRTLRLPERVTAAPGEWRVVVTLHDQVLRQFRVEVPPAAAP